MLLNSSNHQLSIPSKTLRKPPCPILSTSLFPSLIPLHFRNPNKLPRNFFIVRASSSNDTQTLSQSAIKRIADKLRSLGYVDDNVKSSSRKPSSNSPSTSPGEIFVPLPDQLPKHRVGHTMDPSWSTPGNPVPKPASGPAIRGYNKLRREVWKLKQEDKEKRKAEGTDREKLPTLAELNLPAEELRRLRGLGIALRKKLKLGKAGITEGIVNGIHERWRRTELVKVVCEDMSRLNMKRTHDLLERKTGGLVVWRSGGNIVLYRGPDYKYPYFTEGNPEQDDTSDSDSQIDSGEHDEKEIQSSPMDSATSVGNYVSNNAAQPPLIKGVGYPNRVRFQLPGEAQLVEEADHLLDGLGPRFTDWYGYDPQPVDADLLPATVPGYRRPFRLLPYGVKPILTNDEMNTLRRLGRPLPCHFALGRNRKLQGLAAAILKLWEKCEIAKIAVKRGVQNTNSELMVAELKQLTGGTVLTRDKEYIVLYRGKDFLPAAVSSAIEQRRKHGFHGEERRIASNVSDAQENIHGRVEGSSETGHGEMSEQKPRVSSEERKLRSRKIAIGRTSAKLSMTLEKKERAEKLLEELKNEEMLKQPDVDKEGITKEERYMLRRVGLKMRPFLLLGRRGVFDGTVENMHLHWKYRELVKILSGEKSAEEVYAVARILEAESGGILVAVERVSKGHAIIVYRGKNYKRPASLRPRTLLSKREALKRSIEAQRRESLKLHVLKLSRNVDELKLKLEKDMATINVQPASGSKFTFGNKQNEEESQSAEYKGPETDLEISSPDPTSDQTTVLLKASNSNSHGPDSISSNPNDDMDAASDSLEAMQKDVSIEFFVESQVMEEGLDAAELKSDETRERVKIVQQDILTTFSVKSADGYGHEFHQTESKALSEPVTETDPTMEMNNRSVEVDPIDFTSPSLKYPDDRKLQGQTSYSGTRNCVSRMSDTKNQFPSANSRIAIYKDNKSSRNSLRAAPLSNKERLLLRKQALKMKKLPILAVGKSNIVKGVAKNIKAHFERHPLAIVNVKGRAKGTSVQEVVSMLEEATGGVLVSQEPSKVILYRGWGANEAPNKARGGNTSAPKEGTDKPIISQELIEAIRLECGMQSDQKTESGG